MPAPRNPEQNQEFFPVPFRHEALTATATVKAWKVPAGRSFRIDRILYNNPTGLAEDTANNFTLEVKNGATSLADIVFVGEADDDTGTAAAHGMVTGAGPYRVVNAGGALPTGLLAHTNYWIIRVSANTFKFATTRANALAGTAIDLTGDGSGTNTLVRNLITRVFNTDADLTPDIGASLGAGTDLEFTSDSTVMSRVVAGGDNILLVFTETGTATLPPGHGVIEGRLL
jgi:hypothetical protein